MHLTSNPRAQAITALLTSAMLVPVGVLVAASLAATDRASAHPATPAHLGWSSGPVYAIALTWEDPPQVPDGPNREQFTANCRLCHSPRLPLTQPLLTKKKWQEVVHKMAAVYGAPIRPEDEPALVAYLVAVRGKEQ